MKRFARRTAAVTLGLVMGWVAAGTIPALAPRHTLAADEHAAPAAGAPAGEGEHGHARVAPMEHPVGPVPRESAAGAGPAGEEHEEHGQAAAPLLRPLASDMAWYRPVLAAAGGLFALAILVGWAYKGLGIPT